MWKRDGDWRQASAEGAGNGVQKIKRRSVYAVKIPVKLFQGTRVMKERVLFGESATRQLLTTLCLECIIPFKNSESVD